MADEVSPEIIKKTQKILGKHVKKPPLTEKLLKKPPFRFLHDVVKTVVKETGFLRGLFTEEELQSENIKDKDAKVAFLNKLIEAVQTVTKVNLAVKSSKVVAGLEAANTNVLLQAIGNAIDSKLDSTDYVSHLSSDGQVDTDKKKKKSNTLKGKDEKIKSTSKTNTKVLKDSKESTVRERSKKPEDATPKSKKVMTPKESARSKKDDGKVNEKESKTKSSLKESKTKLKQEKSSIPQILTPKNIFTEEIIPIKNIETGQSENKPNKKEEKESSQELEEYKKVENEEVVITTNETEEIRNIAEKRNPSARPKSARPKSGENRESRKQKTVEHEEMTVNQTERPKNSLRPPSVRPSSARPGAPRLRPDSALPLQEPVTMGNINVIVENVDNADDEETVVIETAIDEVPEDRIDASEVQLGNKGHLVEQILEQIKDGEEGRTKVEIDWEGDALNNREKPSKETSQLRTALQTLTKTAIPLGKLLSYLHEDIDTMQNELQMWTYTKKQLYSEIQKQKKLSADSNKPLLARLENLRQEIKKQKQEIDNVQCNIIKNDLRIKELCTE